MSFDIAVGAGGAAFGSGEHPSTLGALQAMRRLKEEGLSPARVLDMGCGSGILSVAAAELWPGTNILAADIVKEAVETTLANARRNGAEARIEALQSDGFAHPRIQGAGPYDLIAANILAEPLIRMSADFRRHLAAGGYAILSGILAWLEEDVRAALEVTDLRIQAIQPIGQWRALAVTAKDGT